jgi:hypothetical protein
MPQPMKEAAGSLAPSFLIGSIDAQVRLPRHDEALAAAAVESLRSHDGLARFSLIHLCLIERSKRPL